MRLRKRLMRLKRAVRPGNADDQVADLRPGLGANVRHRNIVDRQAAVLDVDEQRRARIEAAQQRGLADAVRADDQNARATRLGEAFFR